MLRKLIHTALAAAVLSVPASTWAAATYEVQLKKAWVEAFKDRTTIEADMVVHHSHKNPNKISKSPEDGDLHFSGESDHVGLPFVAEIVNAATEKDAVKFVKTTAKANEDDPDNATAIRITGAWRLWFEHPSKSQVQGADNAFHPDHTNPDHSFEIHPVSFVGSDAQSFDILNSIVPVQDFTTNKFMEAYDAQTAFPYFEGVTISLKASSSAIAIRCQKLRYNYVEFDVELTKKPKKVSDGYIALGRVMSDNAEEDADLPGQLRLIFVAGTVGANTMKTAKAGDSFRLLGIPRLNLNAISFLVGQHGTAQFDAKLPYEMIIVGIYP